jgi:membrane protein
MPRFEMFGGYRRGVFVQSVPAGSPPNQAVRLRGELASLIRGTVSACLRYRVTGLAAEAAFFALLSLPPLLLGLVGTLGYFNDIVGDETVQRVQRSILEGAGTVLSERGVDQVVAPTLEDILGRGRPDITIIGALIALWSGSRALNVYVNTITIAYGMGGRRSIVRTQILAFSLYMVGLVIGVVLLPLVVAGPELVTRVFPESTTTVHLLYWPVVLGLSVAFLTSLYHLAVPERTPWRENVPGAVLALLIWVGGSFLLRLYLGATVEGPSVYGSLAAPVAVLLWLYITALAVLIGAAVNVEVDRIWIRPEVRAESAQPPAQSAAQPTPAPPAGPAPAEPPARQRAEPQAERVRAPAENQETEPVRPA